MIGGADQDWEALSSQVPRWGKLARDADEQTPAGDGGQRMTAKTAAQRQAERKARELAAGRVQWKRWVHPDDVPALAEYADKLARKRARSERAG